MSNSRFPLQNMRKTVSGVWQQIQITETITVGASGLTRLQEVPDNGTINSNPTISGLIETTTYPPTAGTFYVNYTTGDMVFPTLLIGNSYNVLYWKKGSLVTATDINYLYNQTEMILPYSLALGGL